MGLDSWAGRPGGSFVSTNWDDAQAAATLHAATATATATKTHKGYAALLCNASPQTCAMLLHITLRKLAGSW